jgi:tetratricopeptide (TPR) repeat protein
MNRSHRLIGILILATTAILISRPASADYKQAVAYYMQGRYDKTIQELKPDLDQNPDWESGHRLLGLCYLNLKNNALAVSSLSRAVQLRSPAIATYIGLGQAYFNMEKYPDCIQALNQGEPLAVKEKESEQFRFYLLRGSAYYRLEKWNEAIIELTHALRLGQADWASFSMLGIAYYSVNRTDEAIQALEKAVSMKPGQSAAAAEFLGKAYFRNGVAALSAKQYPAAIQLLSKARERNPQDGYIHYNLAEAYLFLKNYSDAERSLNQALERLPKSPEVFMRMGLVYERQKKYDKAFKAYQKADEISPSKALKDAMARVTEMMK